MGVKLSTLFCGKDKDYSSEDTKQGTNKYRSHFIYHEREKKRERERVIGGHTGKN